MSVLWCDVCVCVHGVCVVCAVRVCVGVCVGGVCVCVCVCLWVFCLRMQARHRGALNLQRLFRGYLGRREFDRMEEHRRRFEYVSFHL